MLPKDATEYFHQNVWMGVSQPGPDDVAARDKIGADRFMWGSDYPHDEGTWPYTREHLRARFSSVPEPRCATSSPATSPSCSTTSTSTRSRRWRAKFGPTVDEIAQPIDKIPEKELQRLSADMDAKAIK